jgi:hypothetical protein
MMRALDIKVLIRAFVASILLEVIEMHLLVTFNVTLSIIHLNTQIGNIINVSLLGLNIAQLSRSVKVWQFEIPIPW